MEVRCSGLARPMACAGSLFFENLPEQETNAAAEEGTAAGEYLRLILENKPIPTHASNGVQFDSDMEFYVRPIAEEIKSRAATLILCEQRIDFVTRSGIEIQGSYDVSFADAQGNLYIDDLKYGWGLVEVKDNWQLTAYAIGEVIRLGRVFPKIFLRIHQPRPHHEDGVTRWQELSYTELLAKKEIIDARFDKIASGFKTLETGKQCKYCPAAGAACPAISKAFYRGVEVSHEFMQDNIDDKELSFQLDLVNRVSEVMKIKLDSLNALAVDRIKKGQIIPNYVTESSYGHRKWKKSISPQVIETLTGKKVLKEEMLSPAQAEKIGISKAFVDKLSEQPFLGQKVKRRDATEVGNKIFGNPNTLRGT
jgi:hypothetical protein